VRRPALGAAAVTAAALGIAWSVKAFYSHASVGELAWILSPTVRLVEWGTGASFAYEPDRGWLSREHLFAVVPACAGVNFLIVAFCSLCFGLVGSCRTTPQRAGLLVGAGVAAYATTLLANATRIALALRLHDAAFEPAAEARLHRGLGIAVYFLFLGALLTVAPRVRRPARIRTAFWFIAWLGYVTVTIVAPALRGAGRNPMFVEHAAVTLGLSAALLGAWLAVAHQLQALSQRHARSSSKCRA
jgi:exosortase K